MSTVVAALPPAAAVLVFGVIYGSVAESQLGPMTTVLSSLLIFSGAVQFTLAALIGSGAGTLALVAGASTLNLRNLVLGAVLRPRLRHDRRRRAALAWFLTDEAAGLALASKDEASRVLLISGSMFYVSWQIGTALGVLGASVETLRETATAVFPLLFVGLAAVACTSWSIATRAVLAGVVTAAGTWLWPGSRGLAAVVVAIAVAIPGRDR